MKKKENCIAAASLFWFVCCFVIFAVFLWHFSYRLIDSDMSSEMMLGRLLSEQPGVLLRDWYYSTELRIVNSQLFFEFFFFFTKNWHLVRFLASICIWALLVLSYLFLCQSAGMNRACAFLSSSLLVCPVSAVYTQYVLVGLYYAPHLILIFLAAGLMLRISRSKRSTFLSYFLLLAISFIAGLGGMKDVVCFFFPAFVAALFFLRDVLVSSGVSLIASLSGALTEATVLEKQYTCFHYNQLRIVKPGADKFAMLLRDFMDNSGWYRGVHGSHFLLIAGVIGIASAIVVSLLVILSILRGRGAERFLSGVSVFGTLIVCAVILFADDLHADSTSRYFLEAFVFALPVLSLRAERRIRMARDSSLSIRKASLPVLALFAVCLLITVSGYRYWSHNDRTKDLREVTAAAGEAGYDEGFATFWSCNVCVEITDGQFSMHDFELTEGEPFPLDGRYQWLQQKSTLDDIPEGKFFILFDRTNEYEAPLSEEFLPYCSTILENEHYLLLGCENYGELKKALQ